MTIKEIKGIILLLSISILTAFVFNTLSPHGIAIVGQWEKSKGVVSAVSKTISIESSIEILNPKAIEDIVNDETWTIIDARGIDFYNMGHIPRALSFPLVDFDQNISKIIRSIKKDSKILVYCSSVECEISHMFAERLKQLKYSHVKVFSGGFRQWQEMGNKIIKNEE